MKKLFNKKNRFENVLSILNLSIAIIYCLYSLLFNNLNNFRLLKSNVVSYIILFICSILLIGKILSLTILKTKISQKVNRIIYLSSYLFLFIVLFDVVILTMYHSFKYALTLTIRPDNTSALHVRLNYILIKYHKDILMGIWTTIWLSLAGTVVGLIIALVFIALRTLEIKENDSEFVAFLKKIGIGFVKFYVTIFRGTPMMVQAMIIFYILPVIISTSFNVDIDVINNILSIEVAAFITVTLNTTAYLTEVLRGGIESLNKGQMEAARSLGMSRTKAMLFVVLPQAIKNSLPSICNEFIINIKDTSVLNVIQVMDLFYIIGYINGKTFSNDGIYIAAIIYLCLTLGISKLLGVIEKKMNLDNKPLPSCN